MGKTQITIERGYVHDVLDMHIMNTLGTDHFLTMSCEYDRVKNSKNIVEMVVDVTINIMKTNQIIPVQILTGKTIIDDQSTDLNYHPNLKKLLYQIICNYLKTC
jgi:hypothetical protein